MIRAMKWWDLDRVLVIENDVFGATAWPAESFWGELARPDRHYVVADDGDVLGYAGLWLLAPDADVQTLAVTASAQGRGLGAQAEPTSGASDRSGQEPSHLERDVGRRVGDLG